MYRGPARRLFTCADEEGKTEIPISERVVQTEGTVVRAS